jgi:L-threonylcarbamoyladenylate synthase
VDPFQEQALERLFHIKNRPEEKPILLLVADLAMLYLLVDSVPEVYLSLMEVHWPGPMTLVFPAKHSLSSRLTAGTGTVGVRISPNPVANRLLALFGGPITATSANISGQNPAVNAAEVKSQFGERLDMILDGGPTDGGLGSTLIGMKEKSICCLRQGVIPWRCIENAQEIVSNNGEKR